MGSEWAFPGGASGKESTCRYRLDIRDLGSIHRSRRSPGGGHGNPLQYSCVESTGSQSHTQLKRLSTHAWAVGKKTTLTIPGQVNTGVTQGQCKQTEGGNAYKNPDRESWNKDSLDRNTRQRGHAGNEGKAALGPPTSPSLLSLS